MTKRESLQVFVDKQAHPETAKRFQQARDLAARELGADPSDLSKWEILRELSESYVGLDGAGQWREKP